MHKLFSVVAAFAAATLLSSCAATTPADSSEGAAPANASAELTIYAAASLNGVLDEIASGFTEQYPEWTVRPIVFDGSSTLATQILEGAPVDVFVSADETTMDRLDDAGELAGAPVEVATNTLSIAVAPGNPADVTGLADLANPDLTVVLCAPEVPCGAAANQLLELADVTVRPASEEQNVTAVLTKVTLGEADAGLVYATDIIGAGDTVLGITPEGASEVVNRYPAAVLAGAASPEAAAAFTAYLSSPDAVKILRAAGFLVS